VDYIVFLTADVSVTPNANEIRDYKYVDKAELQAMFADPGACLIRDYHPIERSGRLRRAFVYAMV
jgi:hypothetical protein